MADIGPTLREARIRARIDMSEVEAQTKIRAKYLRAIENEEWDRLPGPVYVKSFLRTYGDYLGLDSRMLIEEFKHRYEAPIEHEASRPIASFPRERERERAPRGPRGPLLPSWAPIAFVLVVIVVALFVVGTVFGGSRTKPSSPKGIHTTAHHHKTPAKTQSAPAPAPPTPQTVTLQMIPTARLYVCLVNAHGRKLIDGQVFTPGETIPSEAGRKLLLTLGNASVQLKANGRTIPISQSTAAIRLLITPSGQQSIPASMQPTCP